MRCMTVERTRRIRAYLRRGGVIAYATESCFGLGCDPHNEKALRALLRIKRRPKSKGLIVIADEMMRFSSLLGAIGEDDMKRMQATWPGPHTWLAPAKESTTHALRGQHPALAVRVTAHIDAKIICARLGMALVSTSANRAGQQPVRTTRECLRRFGDEVMVISGKIGARRTPSTIQDLRTGRILR